MATPPRNDENGGASLVGVLLVAAALVAVVITGTLALRTLDTAGAADQPVTTSQSTSAP